MGFRLSTPLTSKYRLGMEFFISEIKAAILKYHHTHCDDFDQYESLLRCISIIIVVHGNEVLLWEEPIYQLLKKRFCFCAQ